MSPPQYVSVFHPGTDTSRAPLVLLHGSHGSESDLLPLADRLAPGASKLAVRGTVELEDGYAFFRRHADRRVDEADIAHRVPALAALIGELAGRGQLARPPVAIGFSNGAIMAAALLATQPGLLAGAVLFRPLSPFADDASYLPGVTPVLIIDGSEDHRRAAGDGHRLAEKLRRANAVLSHRVLPVGHAITDDDEEIAREWLGLLPVT